METFKEALETALSKAILSRHVDTIKSTLSRIPADSDAKKVELRYWQMAKVVETILELAARMTQEIVKTYQDNGLDPVADAADQTAKLRTNLELPPPIGKVNMYVRTQPSAAKAAAEGRNRSLTSAIVWSVLFPKGRMRNAVNAGLKEADYKIVPGAGQIAIRSYNTCVAAFNGIWDAMTPSEKAASATWTLTMPAVGSASLEASSSQPTVLTEDYDDF